MLNTNTSLRARILAVAGKLQEKKNGGMNNKDIAREVVLHSAFRQGITHLPPKHSTDKRKSIYSNAWVVIYQEEDADFLQVFKRSSPFLSKDEALSFLRKKWGGAVDESLERLMLHEVVFKPNVDEIPIEKAVGRLAEYIGNILNFQPGHRFLGFPEGQC